MQALTYGAFQGAPGERIGARWLHLLAFKNAVDRACDTYGQKKLAALDWFLCGAKPDPNSGPDGAKSAAERRASLEEWAKREPGDFRQGRELLGRRAECDKYLTEQCAYMIADVEEAFRKLDAAFYYSTGDFVKQAAKRKPLEESQRFSRIVAMLEEKVCCADGLRLIKPEAVKKRARAPRKIHVGRCGPDRACSARHHDLLEQSTRLY